MRSWPESKYKFKLIGYGVSYSACLEAALKMKETTYIPCEGMYSSEFKHGPLAIIKKGDWVLHWIGIWFLRLFCFSGRQQVEIAEKSAGLVVHAKVNSDRAILP